MLCYCRSVHWCCVACNDGVTDLAQVVQVVNISGCSSISLQLQYFIIASVRAFTVLSLSIRHQIVYSKHSKERDRQLQRAHTLHLPEQHVF